MATNNNQKETVKQLLLNGCTQKDIAEELKISTSTVKRIKKELIEANPELVQMLSESKYNRYLTKMEDKYLVRISKEQILFEDKEEGWIYHLTTEELAHKQSGKWWSFIVYPESAPENWKEQLINLHCQLSISPLHDKDKWMHDSPAVIEEETGEVIEERGSRYKSGDKKKEHYHGIIKFDRTVSYREANEIIRVITNGPYIQKCMSLKGQYEYFIHLNNPEKYQYEKDEIEKYNGFIVETTQADRIILVDEIGRTIREHHFINIEEVRKYYEGQYEYINVVSLKSYYFEKLTQVNFREKFPEGRTQKVRLVTSTEEED